MKVSIGEFFTPLRLNAPPSGTDYKDAQLLVQAADAFARATNRCVYIIDYYRQGFLYVSDNPLFLCGKSVDYVSNAGYRFYFSHVPTEDLELLLKINEAGFAFYNQLAVSERLKYSIAYDFHLIHPNKQQVLINHHLTPLTLDRQANIWLALCVVSLSSNTRSGNIRITKKGSADYFVYDVVNRQWEKRKQVKLTLKEKEVLTLSMKGLAIKEIARQLAVADPTIKFHRKNILQKFGVRNMAEALSYAANHSVL